MELKKLSEIPVGKKCIYMSVGPHAGESLKDIMLRKEGEVNANDLRWSLWAFYSTIADRVVPFCKDEDSIYVIMAKTGKPTKGKVVEAKYYRDNDQGELIKIPDGITVTYSGKSSAWALVVEKYYQIASEDNIFAKGSYERVGHFNGFELLEKKQEPVSKRTCEVEYVAKLKPPFCVSIK